MIEIIGGILVLALMISFSGIKTVKEHERLVVFRFGRLHRSCEPGLKFIVPLIEHCTPVDVRPQEISLPNRDVAAADGVRISCSAICNFGIKDVLKVVSTAVNLEETMRSALEVSLSNTVSTFTSDEILHERRRINLYLKRALETRLLSTGIVLLSVQTLHLDKASPNQPAMASQDQQGAG